MQARIKRRGLTAFFLSVLAPFGGLFYVHKTMRGLVCSLILLAVCAGIAKFDLLDSFQGLAFCLGVIGLVWAYSTLSAVLLARKGLTPEEAQHDIGPWLIGYLLTMLCASFLLDLSSYKGYAIASVNMEPSLAVGDYVFGRRQPFAASAEARAAETGRTPRAGDMVMIADNAGVNYVRRLAGLPGDILERRGDDLYRNGEKSFALRGAMLPGDVQTWRVPAQTVFVLADNPALATLFHACPVPFALVDAELLYIYWSDDLSRLGDF